MAWRSQMLLTLAAVTISLAIAEEGKCPAGVSSVEPSTLESTSGWSVFFFWFLAVYIILFFMFGLYSRWQHTPGSPFYADPEHREEGQCSIRGKNKGFSLPRPLFTHKVTTPTMTPALLCPARHTHTHLRSRFSRRTAIYSGRQL